MSQGNWDPGRAVYLLWHTDSHGDEKLIGVYATEEQATSVITRIRTSRVFRVRAGNSRLRGMSSIGITGVKAFSDAKISVFPTGFARPTLSNE
jgi:hypothetical protein